MKLFKRAVKTTKKHELVIGSLLVLYLVLNVQTPNEIAPMFNNLIAQILLSILALSIFVNVNPVLGVIVLISTFEFIRRTSKLSVGYAIKNFMPTQSHKDEIINAVNENPIPKTLEEEVVDRMAPVGGVQAPELSGSSFSPVLNNLHDASSI